MISFGKGMRRGANPIPRLSDQISASSPKITERLLLAFMMLSFMVSISSCFRPEKSSKPDDAFYSRLRERMVQDQIIRRGVTDTLVLAAMRKVPRHEYVPKDIRKSAYADGALPVGEGQTISQPYIVALMTELLELTGNERVLEIGTGSGYQAAILAEIVKEVYTIEILEPLARRAKKTLEKMGYKNITTKCGDGYQGWEEHAPFDAIIVTAAPDHIPQPLVDQLKMGGRMVIPVGDWYQELILLRKTEKGVVRKNIIPVKFVPMTGEAQRGR